MEHIVEGHGHLFSLNFGPIAAMFELLATNISVGGERAV